MRFFNRRAAVVVHDLSMVGVAWLGAVALPHVLQESMPQPEILLYTQGYNLLLILLLQSLLFWNYGLYRGLWRFASVPDLWNIVRSAAVGTLFVALALILFNRLQSTPRSTLLLYPLFLTALLGGPRLAYRLWRENSLQFLLEAKPEYRVLILGAGLSGELLARDMLRHTETLPVGFLDDQKSLWGARIHGVPVLGGVNQLNDTVRDLEINLVIIAMPSATDAQMRRTVELCEQCGVAFRTLPKLEDMVSREPRFAELRQVAIDDLLGREKIQLDWRVIANRLKGKVVLVSGGGGSIGSELCRQIMRLEPERLVIFERTEFNLYQVEMKLRGEFPDAAIHTHLGDVCDPLGLRYIFERYRPQVVFHAAAYKHVPMLQHQVREAVRNNVLGTYTLARATIEAGCPVFVLISTDKAVNPTNVMGATKRLAEMLCQSLNLAHDTRFITVRFGNVLGSAGSVVPLFQQQIARGGPVTVTHPEVSRYFMTIPESCQLILQAGAMGRGGEIFVLDMGVPVRILYLAEQLIRLSGKRPGKDIEIRFIGLRSGEKLHEELFHIDEETLSRTRHDKILLAASRACAWSILAPSLETAQTACDAYDEESLCRLLKEWVPEYQEMVME